MSGSLRLGLFLASFGVLVVIVAAVVRKRLNIKYSIVWLLWSLFTVFMAVFPEIFYDLSDILGIQLPVNTVFLIMTALLYALTFYVYLTISKHNEEIIRLTYGNASDRKDNEELAAEIARLKKEVEELKRK